jgi:tripartite-type tricarboxylate transporter receptor subunit TctC
MKRRDLLIAAASLALPFSAGAQQAFPSKPITWVVGFPPGGGADGHTNIRLD